MFYIRSWRHLVNPKPAPTRSADSAPAQLHVVPGRILKFWRGQGEKTVSEDYDRTKEEVSSILNSPLHFPTLDGISSRYR